MRKRAGVARVLVLDPQIILCDGPDSGLDPVRTACLSQLLIDLNAEIDATILIVTHDIQIARTVPDNIGMLFRGNLVMFGPREVLLTSTDAVITQFVNGRRAGPIGMSEEKDEATVALEQAAEARNGRADGLPALVPQLTPSPGLPERLAVQRRMDRVLDLMHTLPAEAQEAILASLPAGPRQTGPPQTAPLQAAQPRPATSLTPEPPPPSPARAETDETPADQWTGDPP